MVPGGMIEVAVKTLNKDSSDHNEIKFLREAAIMGQFLHPNVVKLFGVVTLGEPVSTNLVSSPDKNKVSCSCVLTEQAKIQFVSCLEGEPSDIFGLF